MAISYVSLQLSPNAANNYAPLLALTNVTSVELTVLENGLLNVSYVRDTAVSNSEVSLNICEVSEVGAIVTANINAAVSVRSIDVVQLLDSRMAVASVIATS